MKTHNCRNLAVLVASIVGLAGAADTVAKEGAPEPRGGGSCFSVAGGGASTWVICDDEITDNGLPAGGSCDTGIPGSGASIDDASTTTGGGDAFDFASLLFVNNSQVGGIATQNGNSVSFAPSTVAGLTRQLRYDVLTSQSTTRVVFTLTNTTGAPISPAVNYVGNFGSDGGTVINGTFSGDTVFTAADEWFVSSDGGDGDPVNTTVLFGGTSPPASTPTSVSQTAFNCAGPEGYNVLFNPTVPANGSITFLFFQRLSDTAAGAVPAAADFSNIDLTSPLVAGLSAAEINRLVNFSFGPVGPPPPIPMLSNRMLLLLGLGLALFGVIAVRMNLSRG